MLCHLFYHPSIFFSLPHALHNQPLLSLSCFYLFTYLFISENRVCLSHLHFLLSHQGFHPVHTLHLFTRPILSILSHSFSSISFLSSAYTIINFSFLDTVTSRHSKRLSNCLRISLNHPVWKVTLTLNPLLLPQITLWGFNVSKIIPALAF